jgi:hypothetical protein
MHSRSMMKSSRARAEPGPGRRWPSAAAANAIPGLGYVRDEGGATIWFWLSPAARYGSAAPVRAPLASA